MKKPTLAEINPQLAKQWHPSRNGNLTSGDVTPNSGKKVWWKCPKGDDHEWRAVIANRNKGIGCPICSNQKCVKSNSLASANPRLAKEWHPTKNQGLTPFDVLPGTARRVWWKCNKDSKHEYQASVLNRSHGKGCPICINFKVVKSNCLATVCPELAKQWHPTKNRELTPNDVVAGTNKKIWWKCPKGDDHAWQATGNHRVNGTGCPKCNPVWSIPELRIYSELETIFPTIQHRAILGGHEVDIYIPELNFCIEYDGVFWHQDKHLKDQGKNMGLGSSTILIRVREQDLPLLGPYDISIRKRSLSVSTIKKILRTIIKLREITSAETISKIHKYLKTNNWVADKRFNKMYFERNIVKHEDSLGFLFPNLAKEWHPIKNAPWLPKHFTPGSGRKMWWLGKCGHEWQDSINHRSMGRDCPQCRYKRAKKTRLMKKKSPGQIELV